MDTTTTRRPGVQTAARPARRFADNERQLAIWFLLPSIVYVVALVAVPFFLAIGFAFSDVTAGDPSFHWVGLDTFRRALDDPDEHARRVRTGLDAARKRSWEELIVAVEAAYATAAR